MNLAERRKGMVEISKNEQNKLKLVIKSSWEKTKKA